MTLYIRNMKTLEQLELLKKHSHTQMISYLNYLYKMQHKLELIKITINIKLKEIMMTRNRIYKERIF